MPDSINNNQKKQASTALCIASGLMLAAAAVSAVFAFMTDSKESTPNTFTVGNVSIELNESKFDREQYKALCPNHSITMEPSVENTGNTSAFVKLDIYVPYSEEGVKIIEDNNEKTVNELFTFTPDQKWEEYGENKVTSIEDTDGNEKKYLIKSYVYADSVPAGESTDPIFSSISFQNIVEGQSIEGVTCDIPIYAHAIQSDGLTMETAFAEYDKIMTGGNE